MTFEPGDRVRLRARLDHQGVTVKLASGGYVLCEAWAGSGIDVGVWPEEALELVIPAPIIRPLPQVERPRD